MPYPLFHVFMYVPVLEISMVLDASLPSFLRTRATDVFVDVDHNKDFCFFMRIRHHLPSLICGNTGMYSPYVWQRLSNPIDQSQHPLHPFDIVNKLTIVDWTYKLKII